MEQAENKNFEQVVLEQLLNSTVLWKIRSAKIIVWSICSEVNQLVTKWETIPGWVFSLTPHTKFQQLHFHDDVNRNISEISKKNISCSHH